MKMTLMGPEILPSRRSDRIAETPPFAEWARQRPRGVTLNRACLTNLMPITTLATTTRLPTDVMERMRPLYLR